MGLSRELDELSMLRATRPLLQLVTKRSTGLTGLAVHKNPLPELVETYESTLALAAATLPATSAYRQSVEALTRRKLRLVSDAKGDVQTAERALDEGQIEQALDVAKDELALMSKMARWKAWEDLQEKPPARQWEYFGRQQE